jgi:hypothetical protein
VQRHHDFRWPLRNGDRHVAHVRGTHEVDRRGDLVLKNADLPRVRRPLACSHVRSFAPTRPLPHSPDADAASASERERLLRHLPQDEVEDCQPEHHDGSEAEHVAEH